MTNHSDLIAAADRLEAAAHQIRLLVNSRPDAEEFDADILRGELNEVKVLADKVALCLPDAPLSEITAAAYSFGFDTLRVPKARYVLQHASGEYTCCNELTEVAIAWAFRLPRETTTPAKLRALGYKNTRTVPEGAYATVWELDAEVT